MTVELREEKLMGAKETGEIWDFIVAVTAKTKEALSDGLQASDVALLLEPMITKAGPAFEGLDKLDDEHREALGNAINSHLAGTGRVVEVLVKK